MSFEPLQQVMGLIVTIDLPLKSKPPLAVVVLLFCNYPIRVIGRELRIDDGVMGVSLE